jgi:DNA-binding transcriptional LysR family regulator
MTIPTRLSSRQPVGRGAAPEMSRKVSELEVHLQTKLFNRTSRALVLTDAGRSFVAAAKRILADVAEGLKARARAA